jgi:copper transporter 1
MDDHQHHHNHNDMHEGHGDAAGSVATTAAAVVAAVVENATEVLAHIGHEAKSVVAPAGDHARNHHSHHNHHGSDITSNAAPLHDHSSHSMRMWFHGGYEEVILFDWWRIESFSGMLFSVIVIFAMATLYEGLKWLRVYLQTWADQANRNLQQMPMRTVNGHSVEEALIEKNVANGRGQTLSEQVYSPTVQSVSDGKRPVGIFLQFINTKDQSPYSAFRLLQTFIYCIQLTLAYWLMLIAMTYNTYLTAAVVLGAGFGHWLFAILKPMPFCADRTDTFASDACH